MASKKVKEAIEAFRIPKGIVFNGELWQNELALKEHAKVYFPTKELFIKDDLTGEHAENWETYIKIKNNIVSV